MSTITVLSDIAFKLDVDLGLLWEGCARSMGLTSSLTEARLADRIKERTARRAHNPRNGCLIPYVWSSPDGCGAFLVLTFGLV